MSKKILIITITCFSCFFLFSGFVVGDKAEWTEEKIQESTGKRDSFTDEEKADYNQKLQSLHLEFVKIAANESTAQSISRRMICLPVVYVWLLLTLSSVVAELFALPTVALTHAVEAMSLPSLTAIGFYCGRHIASNLGNKS